MPTIIVFSHLRWNFVFQRPQHLLSRLAAYYPVLFIEEPVQSEDPSATPFLQKSIVAPNVTVCVPHTPVGMPGFHDDQLPHLQELLRPLVAPLVDPIVWLYTPMALPLLPELHARLVIYDCMDELSGFRNAPKQLLQRENAVLRQADLVFTGGPSLYRAKRDRNARVSCFPSSVDVDHFGQALERRQSHVAQQDVPHPRAGYYGVIDERFDCDLIAQLADARPALQIMLVGPVVKIDAAQLPQRPNIHYFGQQPYEALPNFLAGWDVCLLPFALNEATRFISPTKTLEYMAAQLPIVSTRIADVAEPYGDVVRIADDAAGFIAACDAALSEDAEIRARNNARMQEIVAATSWSRTVDQMRSLIDNAAPHAKPVAPADPAVAAVPAAANLDAVRKPAVRSVKCVIIGAGPTGLSAAYHVKDDYLLVDRNAHVGGWCRSVQDKGFTFDYAGHIMFSNDPYVQELYQVLLGDNLHWQDREAWVYSKGVHTRYPFQGALYGLPPKVITECIVGAIEARFGVLPKSGSAAPAGSAAAAVKSAASVATAVAASQEAANAASAADDDAGIDAGDVAEARAENSPQLDQVLPEAEIDDCCADGCVALPVAPLRSSESGAKPGAKPGEKPNFEQFIHTMWGSGIARHFAIPYNKKLWTVPLSEMETSWLGGRVPLPDLEEIIEGALEPVAKPMGPNARFGYPLQGGFQALMNGFLPHLKGTLALNADVVQLSALQRVVTLADGRRYRYDHLISTMPLPALIDMIGDEAPADVRRAAQGLRHISVRCVNLGIGRENLTEKHWIYYPEETIFHRIFVQGNASPGCNPPGGFGLTCEISYSAYKPLPCDGQALIDRCLRDCISVGLVREDDVVLTSNQVDMPYAYVIYDHARAANVATVKDWLAQHDIVLAGRYSEWEYYNSDHAFIAGKKAAEAVRWLAPRRTASSD